MKHGRTRAWVGLLVGLLVGLGSGRAEEVFSRAITPEEFAAAELGKLSPAARARLDALVAAYRSGAVTAVRAEADAQAAAAVVATAAAVAAARQPAPAPPAAPGFWAQAKAKVRIAPGTQVEYGEMESRIAGDFAGWEGHTIFTLENGQRWQVANGGGYYTPAVSHPKVKVSPAKLGGFWMKIEGVNSRVKVLLLEP